MARRKKKSKAKQIADWLKVRPKVMTALAVIILCLCYLPVHAYHVYADDRKFSETRTAMDKVYADITRSLGQPDNINRSDSCFKSSGFFTSSYTCTARTEFIYGLSSRDQADTLLPRIQQIVKASKSFSLVGKPSKTITDSLVFDTYYHDALDHLQGPHHIDCSIKYSFDTPEEVDLSLNNSLALPFEIFFSCSGQANHAVYPAA